MSILVLGTVALDSVKTPVGRKKNILGGSASHFSMSARLFTRVSLVAVIGDDFPRRHIDFLRKKGIVTDSLRRSKGKTFRWEGEYTGSMNSANTLKTELGVLLDFKPFITEKEKKIKNLFLANIDPDIQADLLGNVDSPRLVILDSMNYWIQHKRASLLRVLKMTDIYVANDEEARSLSGEYNLINAAKKLRSYGPRIILIKKGEHGILLYSDKFIFCLPAYPVYSVIDPTGAGDTFAGGFVGYLACSDKINESSIRKAAAYGTVAASFNVEDFGTARTSVLTRKDIEKRLRIFRKITLF